MAKEKKTKEPKASTGFLFKFIFGMGLLFASWFYWPNFEVFFIARYFKAFHSSIEPLFVFALYIFAVLAVVFILARLFKKYPVFLGTFLPIVVYLGFNEWNSYHETIKYIDAKALLVLLFDIYSKRSW